MAKRIGFVGVGLMGSSMAKHLIGAGFPVTVHDVDPAKVDAIVKAGGKKAASPDRITPEVDVIIMSLPTSQIVNDVVRNQLKLFEKGRKGLIVLDTTTADPMMSEELAAQLAEKGIDMLDSTVSGTSDMLAVKDAIFMVGGKEAVYNECKPIFDAMGREHVYMGPNGKGAVVKLIVNHVLSINRMGLAEGLTLAKKAGLDQRQTLEVLKKSAAFSKVMDQKGSRMVNRKFLPPSGHLKIHYKDVRLMMALAAKYDCPVPLLSIDAQALATEMCQGRSDWDSSTIINFYNDLANIRDYGDGNGRQ